MTVTVAPESQVELSIVADVTPEGAASVLGVAGELQGILAHTMRETQVAPPTEPLAFTLENFAVLVVKPTKPPVVNGPPWTTPPPVGGLFLPPPAPTLWTPKVQHDFRTVTALPTDDWSYGGRPGGVPKGCLWEAGQITFDPSWGLIMSAAWSAAVSALLCAAFGTAESVPAPWYMRIYDAILDADIEGLNHLMLAWNAGPDWSNECDILEYGISGGVASHSIARMHDDSSGDVTVPIVTPTTNAVGVIHSHGGSIDNRSGTPTYSIEQDGVLVGTAVIPATNWASLVSTPHWQGVQTESYTGAATSAISRRAILGAEIYVAAA